VYYLKIDILKYFMIICYVKIQYLKMNMSSNTVKQLRIIAKECKIKRFSTMKKNELIESIEKYFQDNDSNYKCLLDNNNSNCNGLVFENNKLKKCCFKTNEKYCTIHKNRYKLEIPEECSICYEKINIENEIPLSCGHIFHKECLIKCKVNNCPICRVNMDKSDIKYIFGKLNTNFSNQLFPIEYNVINNFEDEFEDNFEDEFERNFEDYLEGHFDYCNCELCLEL
jgi:hypothetical protein